MGGDISNLSGYRRSLGYLEAEKQLGIFPFTFYLIAMFEIETDVKLDNPLSHIIPNCFGSLLQILLVYLNAV